MPGPRPPEVDALPGAGEHWTAYSPSVDESTTFDQALGRLSSANQAAFRHISQDIFKTAGLNNVSIHDAVGDTKQWGAENSLFHVIKEKVPPEVSKYIAAWHGLLGNQKAVLHFTQDDNGPDSVYQIHTPETNLETVRKGLDAHNIEFRTIIPTKSGTTILVFDQHRDLRPNVAAYSESVNAPVREAVGTGQFIGDAAGNSRTAARSAYRAIINSFENSLASRPVREGSKPRSNLPDTARTPPNRTHATGKVVRFGAENSRMVEIGKRAQYKELVSNPTPDQLRNWLKHKKHSELIGVLGVDGNLHVTDNDGDSPNILHEDLAFAATGQQGVPIRHRFYVSPEKDGTPMITTHLGAKKSSDVVRVATGLGHKLIRAAVQAPIGGAIVRGVSYKGGERLPEMNEPSPVPDAPAAPTVAALPHPDSLPNVESPAVNPARAFRVPVEKVPAEPQSMPEGPTPEQMAHANQALQETTFPGGNKRTAEYARVFRQISDQFVDSLVRHSEVSHEAKVQYTRNAHLAWSKMPHVAIQRFQAHVTGYEFHQDPYSLTFSIRAIEPRIPPFIVIHGAWINVDGRLILNGQEAEEDEADQRGIERGMPRSEWEYNHDNKSLQVYIHEFGHAIDGRRASRLTASPAWDHAWKREIHTPGLLSSLGGYAAVNHIEGFAEFTRFVYTQHPRGGVTHSEILKDIEKDFPLCSKFMKSSQLWPDIKS